MSDEKPEACLTHKDYKEKTSLKVTVTARIDFEIVAENYIDAFNEAVRSIEIKHKGYKFASYR